MPDDLLPYRLEQVEKSHEKADQRLQSLERLVDRLLSFTPQQHRALQDWADALIAQRIETRTMRREVRIGLILVICSAVMSPLAVLLVQHFGGR